MNPVATSMYRWYGDGGFCELCGGCEAPAYPVLSPAFSPRQDAGAEGTVGGSECQLPRLPPAGYTGSASSESVPVWLFPATLCSPLPGGGVSPHASLLQWLLWSVRMWACPSAGVWLVAVLIFISCRPLERQLGAAKFAVSAVD